MNKQGRQAVCRPPGQRIVSAQKPFPPQEVKAKDTQTIPKERVKYGAQARALLTVEIRSDSAHGLARLRRPAAVSVRRRPKSREGSQEEGTAPATGSDGDLPSIAGPAPSALHPQRTHF